MAAAVAAVLGLLAVAVAPAAAVVQPRVVGMESGDLLQFDKTEELAGTLQVVSGNAYNSTYSALATFATPGQSGYARGIVDVAWSEGDDLWYGAAFYLPPGFLAALDYIDLMRWDNFSTYGDTADSGGIAIYSDDLARLVGGRYDSPGQELLAGPFGLPEGRWFWLEVHQTIGAGAGASLNEVYLDGQLVGSSQLSNSAGRAVDRVRYGIVATSDTSQLEQLSLYFDRAFVGTRALGPHAQPTGPVGGGAVGGGGPQSHPSPPAQQLAAGPRSQCTLIGTRGDDVLVGTPGRDVICGLGGDDVLRGGGGDDTLVGGAGRDRLLGGAGKDVLRAGAGADRVDGGRGKDRIQGDGGRDRIRSADGTRETVLCGGGRDTLTADRLDRARGCERVKRR